MLHFKLLRVHNSPRKSLRCVPHHREGRGVPRVGAANASPAPLLSDGASSRPAAASRSSCQTRISPICSILGVFRVLTLRVSMTASEQAHGLATSPWALHVRQCHSQEPGGCLLLLELCDACDFPHRLSLLHCARVTPSLTMFFLLPSQTPTTQRPPWTITPRSSRGDSSGRVGLASRKLVGGFLSDQ